MHTYSFLHTPSFFCARVQSYLHVFKLALGSSNFVKVSAFQNQIYAEQMFIFYSYHLLICGNDIYSTIGNFYVRFQLVHYEAPY